MQKPNNYDETQAGGEFTPVELGGHKLVIKQVNEMKSKTGKDMIVVLFDFSDDDKQPGYFSEQFANDIRQDKKWPNQATQYILTEDAEGKCTRNFKTFITCVEHSNTGFETKWGKEINNWPAQFKNKKIGGVFGEQMDYYNDEERKKRVLRWFCSLDKVADAIVPNMSETKEYKNYKQGSTMTYTGSSYDNGVYNGDGFLNIPDGIDEELPFN